MATFTNVATLSYNGTVVNSNVTTGEIQQTLAATKHSLATTRTRTPGTSPHAG